jgi:hypothetical protein
MAMIALRRGLQVIFLLLREPGNAFLIGPIKPAFRTSLSFAVSTCQSC